MRKHITSVSTIKREDSTARRVSLTNFVDPSFPSLADFSAATTTDALKWTDLEQNVVYQIVSTRTGNIQHGQSVILSLQKADGSSLSAWACGMLSTELLQNPMIMVSPGCLYWQLGRRRARMGESTIRINCSQGVPKYSQIGPIFLLRRPQRLGVSGN